MTSLRTNRPGVPRPVWYALCFALPALILTAVYALEGFYPFGDKSILVSDMAQQYVEFFCGLKQGGLFFSWSKALGTSYIGVFSYYLSSPLSLLTLLVPNEAMPLGLMALTVLKLGLAGLAFAVFAAGYFDRLDAGTLLCAVCYALNSYAVVYSLCIMWLDGMIWLPVILLGLERLLAGKGKALFAAGLTVCFLSTWYISYMIGGFCCLWFAFRAWGMGLGRRELLAALRGFLLAALWALCLTAWLWLPSFLALSAGKLSTAVMDYSGLFNFDLLDLFPQFLFGRYQHFTNEALPFVFCGTLTLVAAAAYFFLGSIPLRERLGAAGVVLALILSLWLSPLDRVWHLFQYPNWFPYRYTFLLSFFLLFLALHALPRGMDALPAPRAAAGVLAALVCLEMGANARVMLQGIHKDQPYESYSAYVEDYRANADLVDAARERTAGFYRMGAAHDRGLNSPLAFGYPGITHYSSLYSGSVNSTLSALGFAQNWYWCAYYGSTHFTDDLLGIRYVIDRRAVPGYTSAAEADGLSLWENPDALPLVFAAESVDVGESGSPIELQNQIFSALTGESGLLFASASPTVETAGGATVLTYAGTGQPIYLDLTAGGVSDLQVDGQSLFQSDPGTGKCSRLYCLGAPGAGEELTAVVYHRGSWDGTGLSYYCDTKLLADGTARLGDTVEVTAVTGSGVELTARTDRTRPLATTIPAEAGWSAYVDGERAETGTWLNGTFLTLELPAGTHGVTLRYTPPGLVPGAALGILALLAAVLPPALRRRRARRTKRPWPDR